MHPIAWVLVGFDLTVHRLKQGSLVWKTYMLFVSFCVKKNRIPQRKLSLKLISFYDILLLTEAGKWALLRFVSNYRSSPSEVFLGKVVPKICSKFRWEHPCRNAISVKLQRNFIEIELRHGCFPVNCCIFSEDFFLRTPLGGCFWNERPWTWAWFLGNSILMILSLVWFL